MREWDRDVALVEALLYPRLELLPGPPSVARARLEPGGDDDKRVLELADTRDLRGASDLERLTGTIKVDEARAFARSRSSPYPSTYPPTMIPCSDFIAGSPT